MGGTYMVGVSAENRAGAGVAGGDEVDVDIELDTAPREVTVPADFAAALDAEPDAQRTFDRLSNSNKGWHVSSIEGAKTDETRQRRIAKSVRRAARGPASLSDDRRDRCREAVARSDLLMRAPTEGAERRTHHGPGHFKGRNDDRVRSAR